MRLVYKVVGTITYAYRVIRDVQYQGKYSTVYSHEVGTFQTLWGAKRAIRKDIDDNTRRKAAEQSWAGKVFHEQEVTL